MENSNLYSLLITKIQGNQITLDDSILSTAQVSALQEAFLIGNALSITGISPSDLSQDSNMIVLSSGTADVLNCTGLSVEAIFSGDVSDIQVVLMISPGSSWKITDSFSNLTLFPFDLLALSDVCFIFSSAAGVSAPLAPNIPLAAGLNFYSKLSFSGFPALSSLFPSLASDSIEFYGAFSPSGDYPYPVCSITADLGLPNLTIDTPVGNLNLTAPTLHLQVTKPVDSIQSFLFSASTTVDSKLDVSIYISESSGNILILATPKEGVTFSASDIIADLPGGSDFSTYIPSELNTIFSHVGLTYFSISLNLGGSGNKINGINLEIAAVDKNSSGPVNWKIYSGVTLNGLALSLSTLNLSSGNDLKTFSISAKAALFPSVFTGEFDFSISLDNASGSWAVDTISGYYYGRVQLANIVHGIDKDMTLPEVFQGLSFSDFYIVIDKSSSTYTCSGSCEFTLTLDDVSFFSGINLILTDTHGSKDYQLKGQFIIGDSFYLNYSYDKSTSKFQATSIDTGTPLGINTLLNALGCSEQIPTGFDIDLTNVALSYDFTSKSFSFNCVSKTYGTISIAKSSSGIVIIFQSTLSISSGEVPLIGSKIKGLLSFNDVGFVLSTQNISAGDFPMITLPMQSLDKGIYLTADVDIDGHTQNVCGQVYAFPGASSSNNSEPGTNPSAGGTSPGPKQSSASGYDAEQTVVSSTTGSAASTSNSKAFYATINKQIGPIYLARLGFAFSDNILNILLDASIAFGPLSMGFDGLEIGSPISSFDPHASLKGLTLDYHTDDFAIDGAFLRMKDPATGNEEYSGMFALSLTKLQLTALGSYEDDNGNPSLFVYGLLNEPLGGPAFLFVQGLAAAFAYNRNFIAPPVTGVSTFPLITAASGPSGTPAVSTSDLSTMLSSLSQYIPPKSGEYFVGLGLKFTSFKVVNSFALLIVKFGKVLEFDLLGISKYIAPNPTDPNPVAVVELEIVGSYKPAEGTLLVRGQLTPGCYVLSKDCHLEGGFAIAFWTKGQYSGDFVFSFGGYSAHYQPPAHYPQNIPQLGFLWQVDSDVSIKGGGYWAITPKEIMAGGYLKAAYSTSWIRASFDIDAYFLISWSPFHYEAGFNVSFSLEVYVDLLFVSGWIGFTLSEGLALHGPPFGGTAYISLFVCTVHINFGAPPAPKPLLSGSEFASAFLPKAKPGGPLSILGINIERGLVKKETDVNGNDIYFINPKELYITTEAFVPSTGFNFNGNPIPGPKFEIVPMGENYDGTSNTSVHQITITNNASNQNSSQFNWTASPAKEAPRSMWQQYAEGDSVETIITDVDQDRLSPLIFGGEITPAKPMPVSSTSCVARSILADEKFAGNGFNWQALNTFGGLQTAANTISAGNLSNDVFSDLDSLFDFSGSDATDYDGLSARLSEMGATEIFEGTLQGAS